MSAPITRDNSLAVRVQCDRVLRAGWTQSRLAAELGVSLRTLTYWLSGETVPGNHVSRRVLTALSKITC